MNYEGIMAMLKMAEKESEELKKIARNFKAKYNAVKEERDRAVEFIKYLDKNYSSYMTEDEKFEEWR